MDSIKLHDDRITLIHGDCIEAIHKLVDYRTVHMVFADLPYGTTECKWDVLIDPRKLWEQLHAVGKLDASYHLMTGDWPFYKMANVKNYRYSNYWNKISGSNFTQVKNQPFFVIETIEVYSRNKTMKYNPQMIDRDKPYKNNGRRPQARTHKGERNLDDFHVDKTYTQWYPQNLINISRNPGQQVIHPSQKPVELLEYLILTYTNENDLVLDPTMGSGTTGEACINTNRRFIGIERDDTYYNHAVVRLIEKTMSIEEVK